MNIMYINHEDSLGGASKSLLGVIDQLSLYKDVNITVVVPKGGKGTFEEELKKRNLNYIKLRYSWWMVPKKESSKLPLKFKIKIKNFVASLKLAYICKKSRIDIIHTNSSVINLGALVSKLTGIKHVWHIREFGDDDHNLKFVYKMPKVEALFNTSTKVIAISKAIYKKYENIIDNSKLTLIYNGVEKRTKKNKSIIANKEEFNVLLAGAIKENKGQKQAILAIENLVKNGQNNVILNLAGNGEDGYDKYLQELVKELNIKNNVKFLGFTKDLSSIRDNMDVELVCSKKEAFGRVTVEAMMSGNPVIGANTGATTELITPKYNGLLYNDGDVEELAKNIKFFLDNPEEKIKIGLNGYEFAVNNFTSEINAKNIYNLYKVLI